MLLGQIRRIEKLRVNVTKENSRYGQQQQQKKKKTPLNIRENKNED